MPTNNTDAKPGKRSPLLGRDLEDNAPSKAPEEFIGKPVAKPPGEDDDPVNAVARCFKNLEKIRHNQGMTVTEGSLSCLPSGQMRNGDSAGRLWQVIFIKARQKKEKEQQFKALLHQIEELNRQIELHQERYDKLDAQEKALETYIDELENGKKPEMTDEIRDAIKEYEKRTGKKVDPNDLHTMLLVLEGVKVDKAKEAEIILELKDAKDRAQATAEEYKKDPENPKWDTEINELLQDTEGLIKIKEVAHYTDHTTTVDIAKKAGLTQDTANKVASVNSLDDLLALNPISAAPITPEYNLVASQTKPPVQQAEVESTQNPKTDSGPTNIA